MHAITECLGGVFMTRGYANPRLPLPYLPPGHPPLFNPVQCQMDSRWQCRATSVCYA